MKKNNLVFDFTWTAVLLAVVCFFAWPVTRGIFGTVNGLHPYLIGFVKFALLATMGELLALRIVSGEWRKPTGLTYRACIWGFFGMTFVIIFSIFGKGVTGSMDKGLLPAFKELPMVSKLLFAFFTSALMNLAFAPTFMAFHRITDTYIDLGEGKLGKIVKIRLEDVVKKIDWNGFISFVVLKTIPIFWIPAHTITFLLPEQYRVLMAAFLSIALGGILAFAKKKAATAKMA